MWNIRHMECKNARPGNTLNKLMKDILFLVQISVELVLSTVSYFYALALSVLQLLFTFHTHRTFQTDKMENSHSQEEMEIFSGLNIRSKITILDPHRLVSRVPTSSSQSQISRVCRNSFRFAMSYLFEYRTVFIDGRTSTVRIQCSHSPL